MLLFYVGTDLFACDAEEVMEVVPNVKLKHIAGLSTFVAGVLNFGGSSVPIIDFCQLLAKRKCLDCMHTRIILFKKDPETQSPIPAMGIIAEKVIQIEEVNVEHFMTEPRTVAAFPYFKGIISSGNRSIQLISLPHLYEAMKETAQI